MTVTRTEQPAPDYVAGHGLLRGKTVVVTAAAGAGIGASMVRRCLEEDARAVVLSDTHERRLAEAQDVLAKEFGEDRVSSVSCDVTDEEQVTALLDAAEPFGGVDVMVNNAGLGGTASVLEMTDEQWSRVLDITLTGTFRCVRAAGNRMTEAEEGRHRQQRLGHRVEGAGGTSTLCRREGRRDGADQVRRDRPAHHGIRVNAVSPSLAMHPFLAKVTSDDLLAELKQREAFGRAAEPWEVANVMVFLASDYSSYMTGEVVSVSSQHA